MSSSYTLPAGASPVFTANTDSGFLDFGGGGDSSSSATNFLKDALAGILGGLGGSSAGGSYGLSSEDIEDLTDLVERKAEDLNDLVRSQRDKIGSYFGVSPQDFRLAQLNRFTQEGDRIESQYNPRLYGYTPNLRPQTQEFVGDMRSAIGEFGLLNPASRFYSVATNPPVVQLDKKQIDKNMEYMEDISRAIGKSREGYDDIVGDYQGSQTQEFIYAPGGKDYNPTAIAGRLNSPAMQQAYFNPTTDYLPLTKY